MFGVTPAPCPKNARARPLDRVVVGRAFCPLTKTTYNQRTGTMTFEELFGSGPDHRMSKALWFSDRAAPCFGCGGVVVQYITDDDDTLISVRCLACQRCDEFQPSPGMVLRTSADIAAAHRAS